MEQQLIWAKGSIQGESIYANIVSENGVRVTLHAKLKVQF